jgi:hypothetical protein
MHERRRGIARESVSLDAVSVIEDRVPQVGRKATTHRARAPAREAVVAR